MSTKDKTRINLLSQKQQNILLFLCILAGSLFLVPLVYLFDSLTNGPSETFQSMPWSEVYSMSFNTGLLAFNVVAIASLVSITQVYLYFSASKKYRKLIHYLSLLPLALPAYVLAFIFVGAIGVGSPIDVLLFQNYKTLHSFLPSQDSFFMASICLALVLSPYMYMNLRIALASIPQSLRESASLLSRDRWHSLRQLYVSYIFPWWKKAAILICLECIADFGAVSTFNVDTFSTAIYRHWFALFSLESAREISSIIVILVLLVLFSLKMESFHSWKTAGNLNFNYKLPKNRSLFFVATLFFIVSTIFSVFFPLAQLLKWSTEVSNPLKFAFSYITNTFSISFFALILASAVSLLFLYLVRFRKGKLSHWLNEAVQLGYGIPGTILAVAIFVPLTSLDQYIAKFFGQTELISGSILICIVGLSFRFFRVLHHPMQSYFQSLSYSLEENAMLLTNKKRRVISKLHFALLRPVYLSAALMFFIDCFKEMPIQLMTRSFDWDTLSIKIYEYTSEGEWERAAVLSLTLVLLGLIPIFMLSGDRK